MSNDAKNSPTDILGRPVQVGDTVLCVNGSRSYYYFTQGVVHSVQNENSAQVLFEGMKKPSRKQYEKLVVVNGQIDANKTDFPELFI